MNPSQHTTVKVYVKFADGGARDWQTPQQILATYSKLHGDGLSGKKLIDELFSDDWAAPPQLVVLSWTNSDGQSSEIVIPYE
jgi:hypothetical protein